MLFYCSDYPSFLFVVQLILFNQHFVLIVFIHVQNKANFHMKSFAHSLAFIMRVSKVCYICTV